MEWISVKDDMPGNEDWTNDLVLFTDGSNIRNGNYDYEDGFWHERYGGKYIDIKSHMKDKIKGGHITHWMPLPNLPKQ